jgi:hypothetical protein
MQLNLEFPEITVWKWPKCHVLQEQSPAPTKFENLPPLFQPDSAESSHPAINREWLPLYKAIDLGA